MPQIKRIALLGSTGSIGRQTLDVVNAHENRFRITALSCGKSAEEIVSQARRFSPELVAVAEEDAAARVRDALAGTGIEVESGPEAATLCALHSEVDLVVAAAVGIAGLPAVWEAVRQGRTIALANKEPLVVAGHLIAAEAKRTGATLLPVDSEHSAIFQTLLGQPREAVASVTLTASGGAFRELQPDQLMKVTPEQALAHPTWKMGPKVTVDSATLMNKGLELIEAHWLFAVPLERLKIVLHRESIVHSIIDFIDGTSLAHLALPDMRLPIQFALSYPERLPGLAASPNLSQVESLTFSPFEEDRWPCVALARRALELGGDSPAALNAADEAAVSLFLAGKISFPAITKIVAGILANHKVGEGASIQDLQEVDRRVRRTVEENLKSFLS